MNHTVIFVHGFGVMKDARGMFTEIAGALTESGISCVLIDLNIKDEVGNIVLNTFDEQVRILKEEYKKNEDNTIDLVCHSQGCLVAALANLQGVRKTIFLAPPTENNIQQSIAYFSKNPLTFIDLDGTSKLARRDGTFTIVPTGYWKEIENIDLGTVYGEYLRGHGVHIVKALLDDVISNDAFSAIFIDAKISELEADHDFTGKARPLLVSLCRELIIK